MNQCMASRQSSQLTHLLCSQYRTDTWTSHQCWCNWPWGDTRRCWWGTRLHLHTQCRRPSIHHDTGIGRNPGKVYLVDYIWADIYAILNWKGSPIDLARSQIKHLLASWCNPQTDGSRKCRARIHHHQYTLGLVRALRYIHRDSDKRNCQWCCGIHPHRTDLVSGI